MSKLSIAAASAMLGIALSLSAAVPAARAADKTDCDAVMQSLSSGKDAKEVAKDMNISVGAVLRCKRHAKQAAKAENKTDQGMGSKMSNSSNAGSMGTPAAEPSPK